VPQSSIKGRRTAIDPKTGKWHVDYTFKGLACARLELKSHVAVQYAAYSWIYSDLCDVHDWMTAAYHLAPPIGSTSKDLGTTYLFAPPQSNIKLLKAYMYAAITLYGKCFTETKGRRVRLEESNISGKFREAHRYAMTLRHTITAHAGKTEKEWSTAVLVVADTAEPEGRPLYFEVENSRLGFIDDRTLPVPFLSLVNHVRDGVDQKRLSLFDKMKGTEAKELMARLFGNK
jgi:hypothetical protein